MLKLEKNGSYGQAAAFPFILQIPNPLNPREIQVQVHPGLTVRDYFAAKIVAAMSGYDDDHGNFSSMARDAYRLADAMIQARFETKPSENSQFHEDHMR